MYELYNEYANLSVAESSTNEGNTSGSNTSSNFVSKSTIVTGFNKIINIVREKEVVTTMKFEIDAYLEEGVCVTDGDNSSFSVLEWWKNNSLKYKVLSKMSVDISAIPISAIASKATLSVGERVIDEYRSKLN